MPVELCGKPPSIVYHFDTWVDFTCSLPIQALALLKSPPYRQLPIKPWEADDPAEVLKAP